MHTTRLTHLILLELIISIVLVKGKTLVFELEFREKVKTSYGERKIEKKILFRNKR
jgi:hypothetical protein